MLQGFKRGAGIFLIGVFFGGLLTMIAVTRNPERFLGWVTDRYENIRLEALTEVCLSKLRRSPERLAALKKEPEYAQSVFLRKEGFVEDIGERDQEIVADLCAKKATLSFDRTEEPKILVVPKTE